MYSFSVVKYITPKRHVSSPSLRGSGSGCDWAGCQVSDGAAVSPADSAGGGSICFLLRCVASGNPQFLMGWRMEGLRFFLWASTGSPNMAVSLIRRELWEEPEAERGREREREREGEWGREGWVGRRLIFGNLISEATSLRFCCIILSESQGDGIKLSVAGKPGDRVL